MDDENNYNGKPYFLMDDLGGPPLFLERCPPTSRSRRCGKAARKQRWMRDSQTSAERNFGGAWIPLDRTWMVRNKEKPQIKQASLQYITNPNHTFQGKSL